MQIICKENGICRPKFDYCANFFNFKTVKAKIYFLKIRYASMKYLLFIITLCILSASTQAQTPSDMWKTLGKVTFKGGRDKSVGYDVQTPVFSPEVAALKGKIVTTKGYMIPMNESNGYFALSMKPYQTCYFCGGAGIETVMEVYSKKPIKYSATPITLRGKLKLNDYDVINHLIYILEEAEVVK